MALWFIPILLLSLFLAKGIHSISNKRILYAVIVCLPIVSGILSFFNILLPWNLSVVPYAACFVLVGDLLKPYLEKSSSSTKSKWYWLILAFLVLSAIPQIWRLDMAWNNVLPVIPKTLAALCGCYCIAKISIFITEKMTPVSLGLQAIGRETYIILAFSQIIIASLNHYFDISVIGKYVLLAITLLFISHIKSLILKITRSTVS